jgi:tRNA(Ile2) C34 agmatinyltransferase TiaS
MTHEFNRGICKKCGAKMVPDLSDLNGWKCPNCKREYEITFAKDRSYAGVG